jgi:hypothetical protein
MKRHYLKVLHEVSEESIKTLPGRGELSKLYPNRKKKVTLESANDTLNGQLNEVIRRLYLMAGVLIPLPFIIGKVFIEFFVQYVWAGNVIFILPIIVIVIILLFIFSILLYKKISKQFDRYALSSALFFYVHLSCLVLITPELYGTLQATHVTVRNEVLFDIAITAVSILLAWMLSYIAAAERISRRGKVSLLLAIILVCVMIATLYLIQHL